MVGFLMKILKDVDPADWSNYVLAYDNMLDIILLSSLIFKCYVLRCNVDRLKLLRKPLPVPEPFPEVWMRISKIIGELFPVHLIHNNVFSDRLHLRNHKRDECKVLYDPHTKDLEHCNTMICEQVHLNFHFL